MAIQVPEENANMDDVGPFTPDGRKKVTVKGKGLQESKYTGELALEEKKKPTGKILQPAKG